MSFCEIPIKKWIGNRFAVFAAWLFVLLFMARHGDELLRSITLKIPMTIWNFARFPATWTSFPMHLHHLYQVAIESDAIYSLLNEKKILYRAGIKRSATVFCFIQLCLFCVCVYLNIDWVFSSINRTAT